MLSTKQPAIVLLRLTRIIYRFDQYQFFTIPSPLHLFPECQKTLLARFGLSLVFVSMPTPGSPGVSIFVLLPCI